MQAAGRRDAGRKPTELSGRLSAGIWFRFKIPISALEDFSDHLSWSVFNPAVHF